MNTHPHHHIHPPSYGRAFAVGIALNTAFILAEIAYGLKADSLALLADAGHNVSDVLGLLMAWGAVLLTRKHASERYTYGLQSSSILAALANALLLLVAVGGIGWEAAQRLMHPEPTQASTVIAVAAIGVLINGVTALFFHGGHQHDLNIRGAYLHMAADAGISLGVVIAGAVIMATGWDWVDPVISILILVAIATSTWHLLKESVRLTLHAVPAAIETGAVRHYLSHLQGVGEVHDLHIWAISTTEIALTAHLLMPGGHPGDDFFHRLGHELEARFRITHPTVQIEVGDGEHCHTGCQHEH